MAFLFNIRHVPLGVATKARRITARFPSLFIGGGLHCRIAVLTCLALGGAIQKYSFTPARLGTPHRFGSNGVTSFALLEL
ncbi:MAG: hypothetical protein M0T84_11260 [Betaproteobacteria bacterium]|nr:hypothetical protein [Betaproteobacteria bacterium]